MKNVFCLFVLLLGIMSCDPEVKPLPVPPLRPEFETDPPVASDIFIRKVEGSKEGNLKIEAVFDESEYAKITSDSADAFTLQLDDQRYVLRDNGIAPDEKAGDRIFTTLVQEDLQDLERTLETANKTINESDKKLFQWFELRKVVQPKTDIRPFDLSGFRAGQRVSVSKLGKLLKLIPAGLFARSLVITDLSVIEDPVRTIPNPCAALPGDETKAWTFARLMTEMANTPATGVTPLDFTLHWLQTWSGPRTVNSENVAAKGAAIQQVIDTWDALDGAQDGHFEMRFLPFKLIAIVNRIDLRKSVGYGGGNAGEGRFVFCAVRRVGNNCVPMQDFTIIFEYGVNKSGCANVKAYGQQWYDLTSLPFPSAAYNAALQAITDQFTLANTNAAKPNGSSINQIRTNEIALGGGWELLEFNICNPADPVMAGCVPHHLVNTTVKKEPQVRFNNGNPGNNPAMSQIFANWLNSVPAAKILNNTYDVPVIDPLSTANFLGARSFPNVNLNYHWDAFNAGGAPIITSDVVRQQFGFNTCGECHTRGAHSIGSLLPFQHIRPGPNITGSAVLLSEFMISTTAVPLVVPDPAGRAGVNVLAERSHREDHLQSLVNSNCKFIGLVAALEFQPLNMVH